MSQARQLISDEEYLYILRDMFNLSNVLDDMEFTGLCLWSVCKQLYHRRSTKVIRDTAETQGSM